jgi:hypothetical protein
MHDYNHNYAITLAIALLYHSNRSVQVYTLQKEHTISNIKHPTTYEKQYKST